MLQQVLECTHALSAAFLRAPRTMGPKTQNAGIFHFCGRTGGDSRVAISESGSNFPWVGVGAVGVG